jgi:uncharacterized protein YigA (DUF484 family)
MKYKITIIVDSVDNVEDELERAIEHAIDNSNTFSRIKDIDIEKKG